MKFCPKCNSEYDDSDNFCRIDGTKLEEKIEQNLNDTSEKSQNTNIDQGFVNFVENYSNPENDMAKAILFGKLDDLKRIINERKEKSNEEKNIFKFCYKKNDELSISIYDISRSHDIEILKFLRSQGLDFIEYNYNDDDEDEVNTSEVSENVLDEILNRYNYMLNVYREDPNTDFSNEGDIFHSEEDIHNKFMPMIDYLIHTNCYLELSFGMTVEEKIIDKNLNKVLDLLLEKNIISPNDTFKIHKPWYLNYCLKNGILSQEEAEEKAQLEMSLLYKAMFVQNSFELVKILVDYGADCSNINLDNYKIGNSLERKKIKDYILEHL